MAESRSAAPGLEHPVEPLRPDDVNRRIVDSSEDCLKILDLDGRVAYVNRAGVRHMELSTAAEMLGRPYLDFWEEGREAARDAITDAREIGRGTFQGLSRTATGATKWFDVVITPITNDAGAVVQFLAVGRDRTQRRREEDFRDGQHRVLEMIATGAPLRGILDHLALLVEGQSNMKCSVVLAEDDGTHLRHGAAPTLPAAYVSVIDGMPIGPRAGSCGTAIFLGKTVVVSDIATDPRWEDYVHVARDFGFGACWSTPISSSQRKVLGAVALYDSKPRSPSVDELRLLDVAAYLAGIAIERQRAHQALHQSEQRTRAILRAIPDWMFVTNADGVFLDYHAKDPAKLLVPPSAFLGRTIYDVLPPALAQSLGAAFARALTSDEPEKLDYTIGSDQEERFYEATIVRCADDKVLSIVRDITDRKRAELDVSQQRRELAHLSRVSMLGELTGALAHELSQPLAAILSNAQAARRLLDLRPLNTDELTGALDDIIRNDKRAGAVIDRLRALLRKSGPPLQPLNLNEIAREVLDLAHSDLLARRISVAPRLDADIPSVLGDRVQLQQVVLNLLLNACDAMAGNEPDGRELTIETATGDGFVEILVSDRGVGIPAAHLSAVFEPFVSFREEGLGLGLAISRSIVVSHGGRITAENNAERGATFRCFFPIAGAAVQATAT